MKATLLARSKEVHDDGSIVEVVIWELPEPLPPCQHNFKHRLFYGRPEVAIVRYDNERGKGDHRHADGTEFPTSLFRSNSCLMTSSSTCVNGVRYESHR